MHWRALISLLLTPAAVALRQPFQEKADRSRRSFLSCTVPIIFAPVAATAAEQPFTGGAFGATCAGFGCNNYNGVDFNGLPKSAAPAGSMPYTEFLAALKAKKIEGVVFQPPAGDVAFALVDGKSVRIGEGWPVEVSNSWSSPQWVVRILQNEGVPYAWNFDLQAKSSYKEKPSYLGDTKAKTLYQPYIPGRSGLSTLRPDFAEGATQPPSMFYTPSAGKL